MMKARKIVLWVATIASSCLLQAMQPKALNTGDIRLSSLPAEESYWQDMPDENKMQAIRLLFEGASKGDQESITRALDSGLESNYRSLHGTTALHWAIFYGHADIVNFLLEKCWDPNIMGIQAPVPIHLSSRGGSNEIFCHDNPPTKRRDNKFDDRNVDWLDDRNVDWRNRAVLSHDGTKVVVYDFAEEDYRDATYKNSQWDIPTYKISQWDIQGNEIKFIMWPWQIKSASFSPDDTKVLVLGRIEAGIWDLQKNDAIMLGKLGDDQYGRVLFSATFNETSSNVITTFGSECPMVWDLSGNSLHPFNRLKNSSKHVISTEFSHDGKKILVGIGQYHNTCSSDVYLVDLGGAILTTIQAKWLTEERSSEEIKLALLSPDDMNIAIIRDSDVTLWDERGRQISTIHINKKDLKGIPSFGDPSVSDDKYHSFGNYLGGGEFLGLAAFSPNGKNLVIKVGPYYDNDDIILAQLLNIRQGTVILLRDRYNPGRIPAGGDYCFVFKSNALQFSPDGQTILAVRADGAVILWDLTGKKLACIPTHKYPIDTQMPSLRGLGRDCFKLSLVDVTAYFVCEGHMVYAASSFGGHAFWDLQGKRVTKTGLAKDGTFGPHFVEDPDSNKDIWTINMGATPFDWSIAQAMTSGDTFILKKLLAYLRQNKVNVASCSTGETIQSVIHAAATAYKRDAEKYRKLCSLIELLGKDSRKLLNIKDESGRNLLDWATEYNLPEMKKLLTERQTPIESPLAPQSSSHDILAPKNSKLPPLSDAGSTSNSIDAKEQKESAEIHYQKKVSSVHIPIDTSQHNAPKIDTGKKSELSVASEKNTGEDSDVKSGQEKEDSECCVCFEEIKERYVIVPCGHARTCYNCITPLKACPLCSQKITQVIKLFV